MKLREGSLTALVDINIISYQRYLMQCDNIIGHGVEAAEVILDEASRVHNQVLGSWCHIDLR